MTLAPLGNEAAFQSLMEQIDLRVREEGVPIPYRPMRAEAILAVELGEAFKHPCPDREPEQDNYSGDDLTIRVHRWFVSRYGERLKLDMSPGSMVILVRGDPWVVRFPRIWGPPPTLICIPDVPTDAWGDLFYKGTRPKGTPKLNVLESIVDLPSGLARELSDAEREDILRFWRLGLDTLHAIELVARKSNLVRLAIADYDATVHHLSHKTGSYGIARYHAMQAAEKMLKAFIERAGGKYKWVHELNALADTARDLGLPELPANWLELAECGPGARYGEIPVSLEEAVRAHLASLGLGYLIATSWPRVSVRLQWGHFCEEAEFERGIWTLHRITDGFRVGAKDEIVFPDPSYLALMFEASTNETELYTVRITLSDRRGSLYMSRLFEAPLKLVEVSTGYPRLGAIRLALHGGWRVPGNVGHFTFNIQVNDELVGRIPLYVLPLPNGHAH